ncbi:MAG TPA: arylsulfatase [Planctomycetota bacterium]|jgi:arylsulfatase
MKHLCGLVVSALVFSVAVSAADAKPNFLIIVADDMGFSDPGCYGGEIQTPNLNKLADGGLRYTQFYNTARCWPSRACILTGYYAQQVRRDEFPGVPGAGNGGRRPAWAKLLPEMLKPLGYRSYHSGKWHVDGKVLDGGFDHSYSLNDHDHNFNPKQHTLDDQPLPPVQPGTDFYTTTAIAQHAIDMLGEHQAKDREKPFFMYLAFTVPHFPVQAPAQDIAIYQDRYKAGWDVLRQERYTRMKSLGLINCALSKLDSDIFPGWNLSQSKLAELIGPGEIGRAVPWDTLTPAQQQFQPVKMAIHAAMVHRMDIEIGRVLDQIKKMEALDNTAIFFVSDNGASAEQIIRGDKHDQTAPPGSAKTFLSIGPGWSSASNTPFRLHKSWVHEGGITTPLIVHWPKGIAARGELRQNTGHLIDIPPTVLELAGGKTAESIDGKPIPACPGKSLVPTFTKDGSVTRDCLWWYHVGNRSLRAGDMKIVATKNGPWELYDLSTDRCESKNLAAEKPEKVKEMEQTWTRMADEIRKQATADMTPEQLKEKKGRKAE